MATEIKTTVPGNMWKVLVKEGDEVKKGDNLSPSIAAASIFRSV